MDWYEVFGLEKDNFNDLELMIADGKFSCHDLLRIPEHTFMKF